MRREYIDMLSRIGQKSFRARFAEPIATCGPLGVFSTSNLWELGRSAVSGTVGLPLRCTMYFGEVLRGISLKAELGASYVFPRT
jgi:hypothetical protein